MPTITVSTGPFKKLDFIGHADAAAYDTQAGKVGACVEEADRSDIYRSLLPEFHEKVFPILTKLAPGVARGVNAKATEAAKAKAKDAARVEDVLEGFVTFANRVKAGVDEATWKEIETEVAALAAKTEADSSPSSRQKGPDKGSLAKATEILGRTTDKIEEAVTKLSDVVPGFALERDAEGVPEKNSLARMIMAWQEASL